MSAPVPDASEMYISAGPTQSRPRSPSPSTKSSTPEEDAREFNKRLLVSLGMLLPALAAIIGVVAWAISAEVVMGAKREAARRASESSLRLTNTKFDYSRFQHNAPVNSLPTKEMLVDPKSSEHHRASENMDFFNQKMEEIGQDLMMRKMDDSTEEMEERNKHKTSRNISPLNDKLREKLTQENLAQLIEKLLSNHKGRNSKSPQIVVVAPGASRKQNASRPVIETKVTTTKPIAFNLKMASAKEEKGPSTKSSSKSSSSATGKSKKSTALASSKRKSSATITKTSKSANQAETSTKSTTGKSVKNYKTKIYEKEIDLLLQKIEKLEKQQNIKAHQKDAIPEKVANSELFKGKPSDIADKIKGFFGGSHGGEETEGNGPHGESNDWQPTGGVGMPPPPPPMPPMPFMPFMAPPPMQSQHHPYGAHTHEPSAHYPANHQPPQHPYPPHHGEQYPKESMQMEPSYQEYQHSAANQPIQQNMQQHMPQPMPPSGSSNYEHLHQQGPPQPQHQSRPEYSQPAEYGHNNEGNPEMHPNSMNQMPSPNQPYPIYEGTPNENQATSNKRKKSGLLGKFKLSNIFNSVMPKGKKAKQQEHKPLSDNRNIHVSNSPMEPMMAQESQMYPNVDRGQYGEQPGFSVNFGAGPMGGGGQVKASPMGILKSLMLPLTGIPKWVNGKVVLGIVLENGIGKKPKTIFQHFSTGRIRR